MMPVWAVLVIACTTLLAAIGGAVVLMRLSQKHEQAVLDRFLSRHYEEYTMGNMIRGEIAVDQDAEVRENEPEIQAWLNAQEADLREMEAARSAQ